MGSAGDKNPWVNLRFFLGKTEKPRKGRTGWGNWVFLASKNHPNLAEIGARVERGKLCVN